MKTNTATNRLIAMVMVTAACASEGGPIETEADDDRHPATRAFEGAELTADLDGAGVSAAMMAEEPFTRLGLMWDATDDAVLEVRVSADGVSWSAWSEPELSQVEEIARVGWVDPDGGEATWWQYRIPPGATPPTFVAFEPIAERPLPIDGVQPIDDAEEDGEVALDTAAISTLSTPIGTLRVHSRKDWGGRAPRCSGGSMTPNRITIHHTVTPNADSMSVPARLRQIQAFHMDARGWCDIGYNYLVSRDGRVWRGRGARTVGAHVSNANTGNVGISFLGTYTSSTPTSKSMCGAAKLIRRLHEDYPAVALNRTDVKGHRQYGGTSCPGTRLYDRIGRIITKSKGGCDE
jgi:hypothetical protein